MKKNIIIGTIIFICIILIAVLAVVMLINKNTPKQIRNMTDEIYHMYPDYVDDGVNYFMSSDGYNKMSKEKQVKFAGELLKLYQDNGVIRNLYYDESNLMYTFTYNTGNIKGSLGGVMLKKWDPMMN